PVHSVGVQGDSRTYAPALAIENVDHALATELINRHPAINRVVVCLASNSALADMQVSACSLSPERLERLRNADATVRRISDKAGFDRQVWQFPVILIPVGTPQAPDSIVLRPVDSVDGMTAQSVAMPKALRQEICETLLAQPGISAVFYDLTHKPPGTIEWE